MCKYEAAYLLLITVGKYLGAFGLGWIICELNQSWTIKDYWTKRANKITKG